jgi:hypothetical protein
VTARRGVPGPPGGRSYPIGKVLFEPFTDFPEYSRRLIVIELDRFVLVILFRIGTPLKVIDPFDVVVFLSVPSTVVAGGVPLVKFDLIGTIRVCPPVHVEGSFVDF